MTENQIIGLILLGLFVLIVLASIGNELLRHDNGA